MGVEPQFDNLMSAYTWYTGSKELGELEAEEDLQKCLNLLNLFWIDKEKDDTRMDEADSGQPPSDFPRFNFIDLSPKDKSEFDLIKKRTHGTETLIDREAQYYFARCLHEGKLTKQDKHEHFVITKNQRKPDSPPLNMNLRCAININLGSQKKQKTASESALIGTKQLLQAISRPI